MRVFDPRKPPIPHSVMFYMCCLGVVMDSIAAGTTGSTFFLGSAACFICGATIFYLLDAAGVDRGGKK